MRRILVTIIYETDTKIKIMIIMMYVLRFPVLEKVKFMSFVLFCFVLFVLFWLLLLLLVWTI